MARPPKEINWDIVESYLQSGCKSGVALARKFDVNKDTFYRRFKEEHGHSFQDYQSDSHEVGEEDLRRMIHAKALNNKAPGNSTLLMFLARCRLGMKEPETVHLVAANQTQIDESQLIMQLQHELAELKANANKPEAE